MNSGVCVFGRGGGGDMKGLKIKGIHQEWGEEGARNNGRERVQRIYTGWGNVHSDPLGNPIILCNGTHILYL